MRDYHDLLDRIERLPNETQDASEEDLAKQVSLLISEMEKEALSTRA